MMPPLACDWAEEDVVAAQTIARTRRTLPTSTVRVIEILSRIDVRANVPYPNRLGPRRVELVERIASRHEPEPRTGGAITERAAEELPLQRPSFEQVRGQIRIRQHDPAEADEIDQALAHVVLRHVRQPLLQIAVR